LAPLYRLGDRIRYRKHGNLGAYGEDRAHRWLRRHGFTVAARNWQPPQGGGEIDIVAWEGDFLVFVEVKSRASADGSAPERAIDDEKIRALRRAARDYVVRTGADPARARFDVIAITISAAGEELEHLEHFRDAFAAELSI
jgi:putative endonuclease